MGSPAAVSSSRPLLHRLIPPPPPIQNSNHKPILSIPKPFSLPGRRSLILLTAAGALIPLPVAASNSIGISYSPADASVVVTDRVFMDFGLCPSYFRFDRPIGFDLAACPDSEPLGRVVFGLYGKLVPQTVANFKALCTSSGYRGTVIHKILQGQFFAAGRQGRRDKGEVRIPGDLARNTETVDPKAFQLKHSRPGTLSLCLAQNDDDDEIKLDTDYRNVEFLVTTGPGPCPELDNENIVFGTVLEGPPSSTSSTDDQEKLKSADAKAMDILAQSMSNDILQRVDDCTSARGIWNSLTRMVNESSSTSSTNCIYDAEPFSSSSEEEEEQKARAFCMLAIYGSYHSSDAEAESGMDVVTTIANIPTYKPAERIRQFNDFAVFLGDQRAQIARTTWDRPLRTVYISDCGELKVAKPSLSPSLP